MEAQPLFKYTGSTSTYVKFQNVIAQYRSIISLSPTENYLNKVTTLLFIIFGIGNCLQISTKCLYVRVQTYNIIIVQYKVTKYRRTTAFKSAVRSVRVRLSVARVLGLVLGLV